MAHDRLLMPEKPDRIPAVMILACAVAVALRNYLRMLEGDPPADHDMCR